MNFVEEKQRGLIPPGLQSWSLQLIEHLTNTTSVAPPPASTVGCRPMYLLQLQFNWILLQLNPSFRPIICAPNRCCALHFFLHRLCAQTCVFSSRLVFSFVIAIIDLPACLPTTECPNCGSLCS